MILKNYNPLLLNGIKTSTYILPKTKVSNVLQHPEATHSHSQLITYGPLVRTPWRHVLKNGVPL